MHVFILLKPALFSFIFGNYIAKVTLVIPFFFI